MTIKREPGGSGGETALDPNRVLVVTRVHGCKDDGGEYANGLFLCYLLLYYFPHEQLRT